MMFRFLFGKSKKDEEAERKKREEREAEERAEAERRKAKRDAAAKRVLANMKAAADARSAQEASEADACKTIGLSRAETDTKVREVKRKQTEIEGESGILKPVDGKKPYEIGLAELDEAESEKEATAG